MQQLIEYLSKLGDLITELEKIDEQIKQNPPLSDLRPLRQKRVFQLNSLNLYIKNELPVFPDDDTIKLEIERKYSLDASLIRQAKAGKDYIKDLSRLSDKLEKDIENFTSFYNKFIKQIDNCRQIAGVTPSQSHLDKLMEYFKKSEEASLKQLETLREEINQKIPEVIPIKPNSLVVFFWVLRGTPTTLTGFGHNLKGHAAIAVNRPNPITGKDENVYLSFYPDKDFADESSSWQAKIADWITNAATWLGKKIPTLRDKKGIFASFEHDLYRHIIIEDKYGYESCYRVEIDCSRQSSFKINLDEIYNFINQLQNDSVNFNYLNNNCAVMCLTALKKGGVGRDWNFDIIKTPAKLIDYAERLNYKHEQELLNTSLATVQTAKTRFIKRLEYIKQRLENDIKVFPNDSESNEERKKYNQLIELLEGYILEISDSEDQTFKDTVAKIEQEISGLGLPDGLFRLFKILDPLFPLRSRSYVRTSLDTIISSFPEHAKYDVNINDLVGSLENIRGKFLENFDKDPRSAFLDLTTQLTQLAQTLKERYAPTAVSGTINGIQTIIGKLNQDLYFDTYSSPEPNDKHNLFVHLKELLSIDENTMYPSIFDLIEEAKLKFKTVGHPTKDNKILFDIYDILNNKILGFQEQKLALQYLFKKQWGLTEQEKILRARAFLICTIQAFIKGELASIEFQSALLSVTELCTGNYKQRLANFVESFRIQSYVDVIDWSASSHVQFEEEATYQDLDFNSETVVSSNNLQISHVQFEEVTIYQYLDFNSKTIIGSNNPQIFRDQLSNIDISEINKARSDYTILLRALAKITDNPSYMEVMKGFGSKEFSLLLLSLFNKENSFKHDEEMKDRFDEIFRKAQTDPSLPAHEKIFFDIYNGTKVIKELLEQSNHISHKTIEERLQLLEAQRKTKENDFCFQEVSHFYDVIKSVVYTRRLDDEILLTNLERQQQHYQEALKAFIDNPTITELSTTLEGYHKEEEKTVREVLKIKIFGSKEQKDAVGNYIDVLDDWLNKEENGELKGLLKRFSDYEDNLDNLKDSSYLLQNFKDSLMRINSANTLIDIRNDLKDILNELYKDEKASNIKCGSIYDLKQTSMLQYKKALAIIHKEIYLEDPKFRELLGEFLGVERAHAKTIDIILNEVESNTGNKSTYKTELISIIRNFASGDIDEKEFYHRLSNYIEDHSPRVVVSRKLTWIYRFFASAENVDKYAAMPSLVELRELFVNRYIRLEASRVDAAPNLIKNEKELINAINQYIEQEGKQNSQSIKMQYAPVTFEELKQRADLEKQKHSWLFEGHKRKFSAAKHSTLFGKTDKSISEEKRIELNLLQEHQTKRLAEELLKENLNDDTPGFSR